MPHKEILDVDGISFELTVHIEKRFSSRASLSRHSIHIRIPVFFGRSKQEAEIAKLRAWAVRKIREKKELYSGLPIRKYLHGQTISVQGRPYTLAITNGKGKRFSTRIRGRNISIVLPALSRPDHSRAIGMRIDRLLRKEHQDALCQLAEELNRRHIHSRFRHICYWTQNARWGSCSRTGTIHISSRLLTAPQDILEYVCVHELAHLKEMNHSRRFWDLVASAVPDYRHRKSWLKQHGNELGFY